MAFKPQRNRERKQKKPSSYPRVWLNVKRRFHSLTFSPLCTKLSSAEFKECQAQQRMPTSFSIPILMKDIRNVLFKSDRAVYLHYKVSRYLIANTSFRKSLTFEIEGCEEGIKHYQDKLDKARISRSKSHWQERIEEEERRLKMLHDLKAMLLETV